MSLNNKINTVCDHLDYMSYDNNEFSNQWKYAIYNPTNPECIQVLVDTMLETIEKTHDYRDEHINDLRRNEKIQDNEIKLLKTENKELKEEMKNLKTRLTKLEMNEKLIYVSQACKNIQIYIIKKITGWNKEDMEIKFEIECHNNYKYFKTLYKTYLNEIVFLEKELGIYENDENIRKLKANRNDIAHPDEIDIEELGNICNEICGKYNGITKIVTGYSKIDLNILNN